jgi:hypothetical protein
VPPYNADATPASGNGPSIRRARHTKLSRHKCERLLVKLIVIGTAGMEINESGVKFFLREDLDESKKE